MLIKINEDKPAFVKQINYLKEHSQHKTASGAVLYAIQTFETKQIELNDQYNEISRLRSELEALKDKLQDVKGAVSILNNL